MEPWRLLIEPDHRIHLKDQGRLAAFNMAIDEAISIAHRKGLVPPTFRMYTWPVSAITIGYFQALQNEIDMQACRQSSIAVVRRWTGGRAVLHGRDITYSLVANSPTPAFPANSIRGVFAKTSRIFLRSFQQLGLSVESQETAGPVSNHPVCFSTPSWHEITHGGKKIIGSAQRRWPRGFLQQGSILLEHRPKEFEPFLKTQHPGDRGRLINEIVGTATGLYDISGRMIPVDEIQDVIRDQFSRELQVQFHRGELSPFELELALDLIKRKYDQKLWNHDGVRRRANIDKPSKSVKL